MFAKCRQGPRGSRRLPVVSSRLRAHEYSGLALERHATLEMRAIEDRHWWFRGRRSVLAGDLLAAAALGLRPARLHAWYNRHKG